MSIVGESLACACAELAVLIRMQLRTAHLSLSSDVHDILCAGAGLAALAGAEDFLLSCGSPLDAELASIVTQ
jgi:hypothetical protein